MWTYKCVCINVCTHAQIYMYTYRHKGILRAKQLFLSGSVRHTNLVKDQIFGYCFSVKILTVLLLLSLKPLNRLRRINISLCV